LNLAFQRSLYLFDSLNNPNWHFWWPKGLSSRTCQCQSSNIIIITIISEFLNKNVKFQFIYANNFNHWSLNNRLSHLYVLIIKSASFILLKIKKSLSLSAKDSWVGAFFTSSTGTAVTGFKCSLFFLFLISSKN